MTEKITQTRHIRQQLESLNQQKTNVNSTVKRKIQKYQGLGLNWRDVVILIMVLFFVGLYQVQAHADEYFDLEEVDTGMMLSYHQAGNDYAALKLLSSEYSIDITGIIAQVNIKQTFRNDTANWIEEGMYAFPVADNAAVYQMKLIIGKRVIEAEIHEKQQAQQIYDSAKSQGLAASIVKQYRPNLFTTDVANIMPNEKIQVEITYQQTLRYDAGHIDFRLPLAIKSRYMQEKFLADLDQDDLNLQDAALPIITVLDDKHRNININLETGFELSELKSLNHDVEIVHTPITQTISLLDKQLYDEHDFVLRWYPQRGNEPQAAMFSETLNGEEYVLMMLLPPESSKTLDTENKQSREVVFIIDTSGSMHGNAMSAAKDALFFGLTQLGAQDKFNIIEFNSYARELFEHSVLASTDNLDKAINFIDRLNADGGTNMGPALALAMQDEVAIRHLKQIIFITDGSVGNEAQLFSQIKQNIDAARLFTVAIGAAPNNYFMSKAALIGRGTYTNIDKLKDVDDSMNELFIKLSSPALTDVMIQWNGDVEQNPRIIPDLYSDQPIIVTARMKDFDAEVALSGYANDKIWSKAFAFNQDGASTGVAKLWARNQIADLTDDFMLGADIDASLLQAQITDIALKFHLVSEFTSLVAVDKTPDMTRLVALQAQAMRKAQAVELANFPQTALGWQWRMLVGFMLLFLGLFIRKLLASY